MRPDPFDHPTFVLIAVGAMLGLTLVPAMMVSNEAFDVHNGDWNGASKLRDSAQTAGPRTVVGSNVREYSALDPTTSIALVLAPDRQYGVDDAEAVARFVRRGGTLVVADDFGTEANGLLWGVGAQSRIDGRPLLDERTNYRSPMMPVATNVTDHELIRVGQLTLNRGSTVNPNGATVLVRSSGYSYLDGNRNGRLDETERMRGRPVMTVESIGKGRVIVVSDPSIFINSMLERPGNRIFAHQLFSNHETVLFDHSHTNDLTSVAIASAVIRNSPTIQLVLSLVAILGTVAVTDSRLTSRLRRWVEGSRWTSDPLRWDDRRRDQLVSELVDTNPNWTEESARRAVWKLRQRRNEIEEYTND